MPSAIRRNVVPLTLLAATFVPAAANATNLVIEGLPGNDVVDIQVFAVDGGPHFGTTSGSAGLLPYVDNVGPLGVDLLFTPQGGKDQITFKLSGTATNLGSTPLFSTNVSAGFSYQVSNDGSRAWDAKVELSATNVSLSGLPSGAQLNVFSGARVQFDPLGGPSVVVDVSGSHQFIASQGLQTAQFGIGMANNAVLPHDSTIVSGFFDFSSQFPPGAGLNLGPPSLDLVITFLPIPEPSVWLMLGVGLALVGLRLSGANRKPRRFAA